MGDEKLCQGKDIFERMNYLFQAGQLMSRKDAVAASHCGNMMISCARKAVLRLEPGLKRSICKSCQSPLIPGDTARVRLISKPLKAIQWTCLLCRTTRRIPTKKGYKLWLDQPESVVKIFDYTPKVPEKDQQSGERVIVSQKINIDSEDNVGKIDENT